ncbi:uncharacterized protein LOC142323218 isoform X2 [Lycorma delicatula]|uniref:uncharacterized protein LOC142323218 isoform X2 n=1 Tax=Lycorma delicatula TaxID=130591 RepID=UPI003F50FE11
MSGKKPSGRKYMETPLIMECKEEELSPAQLAALNKGESDFNEILKKLEAIIRKSGDTTDQNIIRFQNNIGQQLQQSAITLSTGGTSTAVNTGIMKSKVVPTSVSGAPVPIAATSNIKPATTAPLVTLQGAQVSQGAGGIVTRPPIQPGGTYQLLMDPRLGLLVGTVTQPSPASPAGSVGQVSHVAKPPGNIVGGKPVSVVTKAPQNVTPIRATTIGGPRRTLVVQNSVTGVTQSQNKVLLPYNQVSTQPTYRLMKPKPSSALQSPLPNQTLRPVEAGSSVGNILKPKPKNPTEPFEADSREITFNKLNGKTFPSLVVVARPHLKIKDMSQAGISQERAYLDGKVKGVLMFSATKFTEWLIQQGLVRSEQYCSIHCNPDKTPVKLKLGMYSDVTKFPHSGGYVWINDCCPNRFVSVFSGSIFEAAPYAPNVLLKLMYHWCCQTSVQNVVQWVKVDSFYVKTFYTSLRAVCTAAIHENYEKLGGQKKRIEVGVISLGTTSQDGNMRQVKVEVLGVLDPESKLIRLRAVEPLQDGEKHYKKRFVKILEPLKDWVHKDSTILTDFTVDKATLMSMGYTTIHQVSINDTSSTNYKNSNAGVMEYLRRIVPRMFQNTLSLLSRQIIQQFLDELVWRERWGYIPSRAFDSLIAHIADQTKIDSGNTLMLSLSLISSDPFKIWKYFTWKNYCTRDKPENELPKNTVPVSSGSGSNTTSKRTQRKRNASPTPTTSCTSVVIQSPSTVLTPVTTQPSTSTSIITSPEERIPLETYYYGTLPGNKSLLEGIKKCKIQVKCCTCGLRIYTNIHLLKHLLVLGCSTSNSCKREDVLTPHCRYCVIDFPSEPLHQHHVKEVHVKPKFICLICEEKFKDRTTLILHMHKIHNELELPYECMICQFRSSERSVVIDHFYEVHYDEEYLQCPFCLLAVRVFINGSPLERHICYFVSHLWRHKKKNLTTRCNKCTLSFTSEDLLTEHRKNKHHSYKEDPDIVRYSVLTSGVLLMPKPLAPVATNEKPLAKKTKESNNNNFIIEKFDKLSLPGALSESKPCVECEGYLFASDHIVGALNCIKCPYATCCVKAMESHNAMFHDPKNPKEYCIGRKIVLDKPMHCVCGFSTLSGNKLARHIASCGKKSAYASAEKAAKNKLHSLSGSFSSPDVLEMETNHSNHTQNEKEIEDTECVKLKNVIVDSSASPTSAQESSDVQEPSIEENETNINHPSSDSSKTETEENNVVRTETGTENADESEAPEQTEKNDVASDPSSSCKLKSESDGKELEEMSSDNQNVDTEISNMEVTSPQPETVTDQEEEINASVNLMT